jgi:hypothetical protein
VAGEHTLVSVGRDGGHDARAYATERAARAMAEWLARLRRYRCHVLVMPDGSTRRLGPDGRDAVAPAAPTEQTELGLSSDYSEAALERQEARLAEHTTKTPELLRRQAD